MLSFIHVESADRIKDSQDLTPPENVENIAYHAGGGEKTNEKFF